MFTAPQLLLHGSGTDGADGAAGLTFEDAVRTTIIIGGENADRGSFIGSILAAQVGDVDVAVPAAWQAKTTQYKAMLELAEAIVDGGKEETRTDGAEDDAATAAAEDGAATTAAAAAVAASGAAAAAPAAPPRPIHPSPRLGNSPGCIAHSNHTTSNATRPPSHPDDVAGLRALYLSTGGPSSWIRNACWLNESVPVW
jgi:hypothetical protein